MADHPMDPALVAAKVAEANASAAKYEAEAREAHASALLNELSAQRSAIDVEREKLKRERELATDDLARVYRFTDSVRDESSKACMAKLSEWHRRDGGCPITIVFSSPGGSVIHGMALFDHIRFIQSKGHRVTTVALGYAASMAGILLQVGDHRVMARESWLLIHQGSAGAMGSMGEIEDTVNWYKRIDARILDIFYTRSRAANPEKPLSKSTLKKNYARKDWWLSSDEAYKHGFCDEVQ
jgi:ATP-dependent Clp endopeptidase proteolytic subunit ClpP